MQFIKCFVLIFIIGSCGVEKDREIKPKLTILDVPTQHSLAPNLFRSPSGLVYMSWIEIESDTVYSLLYTTLEGESWSEPVEITSGTNWFVNWADIPAIVTYDDKHIAAHWLQMSGEGTYDYKIQVTLSKDAGQSWSEPVVPHQEEIPAEYGFVSMAPIDETSFQMVWLDGRNTKNTTAQSDSHDHSGGQMTLRSAILDFDGNLSYEMEIDHRVCDCCQTDMTILDTVPIVIYRDRSESEIRDISISRYVHSEWSDPVKIYNDDWKINGCPVNGPAIAQNQDVISVVWFTADEDSPKVKVARSEDGGKNFSSPIRLDNGNPQGRVDIVPWKDGFLISWVEKKEEQHSLMLAFYEKGVISKTFQAMPVNASRRGGFPIIEPLDDGIIIALTDVLDGRTKIHTQKLVL